MISNRLRGIVPDTDEDEEKVDTEKDTSSAESLTDEEFLNVLRRADRPFVKTGKFADKLGVVQRTAQKRLNRLEEDDRVESEHIGQSKIWWLDESEPTHPIKEPGARVLRLNTRLGWFAKGFGYASLGLFGMSGFLLLMYLTADAQGIVFPVFGNDGVTFAALFLALSAGIGAAIWGLLKGIHTMLKIALKRGLIGTVST